MLLCACCNCCACCACCAAWLAVRHVSVSICTPFQVQQVNLGFTSECRQSAVAQGMGRGTLAARARPHTPPVPFVAFAQAV
jgi:hypothetical protein